MSNPSSISYSLVAAVSNGIAQSQTPLAAGNLTLNGSLVSGGVATMDNARRISIASTGADSAIIFTVNGTDRNKNPISQTVTGVATATGAVATTLDFLTVTSVAVSGATAGAITVGTNSTGSSPWVVDNFLAHFWALAGGITAAANTTYTLEHTYDDPNAQGVPVVPQQWSMAAGGAYPPHVYAFAGIVAASGDNQFTYANQPIMAHRFTINSGTGTVTMDSMQAGID